MGKVFKLGLDIGSTTIKVVLLDGEKIIPAIIRDIIQMFPAF